MPLGIEHWPRGSACKSALQNACLRAEDDEDWRCAGLGGETYSAREKCFSIEQQQLLGLAEAAACASGEDDGGNLHGNECIAAMGEVRMADVGRMQRRGAC